MQTVLTKVKLGQKFSYGGMGWIKLEDKDGMTLALAECAIFTSMFTYITVKDIGQYNDWKNSLLRQRLNGVFFENLVNNATKDNNGYDDFCEMTVDLTSDDGVIEYGKTVDKIALISCKQYRKYRKLIPNCSKMWWTVTPHAHRANRCLSYVNVVGASGALSNEYVDYERCGVRPLCNLKSNISVWQ